MIVLDVNVVLAAHRSDHPHHAIVRPWFESLLAQGATFGVPDLVWGSFIRIATNRRIFVEPNARRGDLRLPSDGPGATLLRGDDAGRAAPRALRGRTTIEIDGDIAREARRIARLDQAGLLPDSRTVEEALTREASQRSGSARSRDMRALVSAFKRLFEDLLPISA